MSVNKIWSDLRKLGCADKLQPRKVVTGDFLKASTIVLYTHQHNALSRVVFKQKKNAKTLFLQQSDYTAINSQETYCFKKLYC